MPIADILGDSSKLPAIQEARTRASKHVQRRLAEKALSRVEDEAPEDMSYPEKRKLAAAVHALTARGPHSFYEVMDEQPSRWSGEDCETTQSRKRANEYHKERYSRRPIANLVPEELETLQKKVDTEIDTVWDVSPLREHVASLPYVYDSGETTEVFDPEKGRPVKVSKTKWRDGSFAISPVSVTFTVSLTPTEKVLLNQLYALKETAPFHKNGRFIVRGITQAFLAQHIGITRRHCTRLLRGLEEMGLIQIRSNMNIEEDGADAVYYLHAHEPSWFAYPIGSTMSGRSRVCARAGERTSAIDWDSVYLNRWVRITRDRQRKPNFQRENGQLVVEEKHRTKRVEKENDLSVGNPFAEALAEWLPSDVDPSFLLPTPGEGAPETKDEFGDIDSLGHDEDPAEGYVDADNYHETTPRPSTGPSLEAQVDRICDLQEGEVSDEERQRIRSGLIRTREEKRKQRRAAGGSPRCG